MPTVRTPETLFAMVDAAAQNAQAQVEQSPDRALHACAAGCTYCCHLPVDVTAPEALRIVAYLRQHVAPDILASLRTRLAATAERIRGLSYEEHTEARIPCALLLHGTCAAYPCRPFACRAWNSTSRASCEEIFARGDPVCMIPPLDMAAYDGVWEIARDLSDGLKHSRLDCHTYELHSILQRALEIPDVTERWLLRDEVFAGCLVGAFPLQA
jgi:Fe-S-cluster containining protein